ncbi:hypothetical protein DFH94DRAFT_688342 [Russula ochroleuca]|uniref:Uncharacterized protein n=1 Tax=Russula ochroleuca TaxID=152965 RepID=A0A9P5N4P1_9AGAM|nr:hypothetical protein DFH94DRAFT_688342 [Russula ochroleuca]
MSFADRVLTDGNTLMKQVHGPEKGTREGKSEGDIRLLAVAINRALQRRLGDIPSPAVVHKAVNKLTNDGAKTSAFVQHATRVQEELARLHARIQLERGQGRQDHAIAAIQDPPVMSSTRPRKRSAGHDDDDSTYPVQEAKRARLDSTGPPRPHPHVPPPTSDIKATVAELPRADPMRSQASADDSPSALHLMATGPPPTPSNNPTSDSNIRTGQRSPNDTADGRSHGQAKSEIARPSEPAPVDPPSAQIHSQDKLGKVPSPSISTAIPEAQGSPLPTIASPATMGVPAYTRQQVAPSASTNAFVANVPGIWAIQVGKPSAGQTDVTFVVDQDTASSVQRWATHRRGLNPDTRLVVVHLVALQTTAVSAVQHTLSQSPGGMTPQAFALALRNLQPQWPDDGSLVLQLNAGQPGEKTWFLSDMSDGMPLDVSGAICEGTNSLRIMQLKNMADIVFAVYAAPPTPKLLASALEWERFRKLYSLQRPPSECSLE